MRKTARSRLQSRNQLGFKGQRCFPGQKGREWTLVNFKPGGGRRRGGGRGGGGQPSPQTLTCRRVGRGRNRSAVPSLRLTQPSWERKQEQVASRGQQGAMQLERQKPSEMFHNRLKYNPTRHWRLEMLYQPFYIKMRNLGHSFDSKQRFSPSFLRRQVNFPF